MENSLFVNRFIFRISLTRINIAIFAKTTTATGRLYIIHLHNCSGDDVNAHSVIVSIIVIVDKNIWNKYISDVDMFVDCLLPQTQVLPNLHY